MKFRVPFAWGSFDRLKKRSTFFRRFVRYKKKSVLEQYLKDSDVDISREDYLSICFSGLVFAFLVVFLFASTALYFVGLQHAILISLGFAVLSAIFVFFSRFVYPKVYSSRRQKNIEKNLIPALDDMLVQLNSGVPLFSILVNISASNYGVLSEEFKKIVRKINAGLDQIEVLEEIGEKNPSIFFRRTLWQISNGMKAGSDISIVIRESIHNLNDEQYVQIQTYGNKLNPMVMFYMLSSVILPALAITFLTVISSLIDLTRSFTIGAFIGMFVVVFFLQIMFLGIIKSIRPSLL